MCSIGSSSVELFRNVTITGQIKAVSRAGRPRLRQRLSAQPPPFPIIESNDTIVVRCNERLKNSRYPRPPEGDHGTTLVIDSRDSELLRT